jgi:integrase
MAKLPAGVRKRDNGSFEKRFTLDGKQRSICAKSLKELEQKEHDLRQQIKDGTYTKNKDLTLDKYFEEWIALREKKVKSNTVLSYKDNYYTYISPALGKCKIRKIEKRQIDLMFVDIQGISVSSKKLVMTVLRMILNDAVNDEIISKNPATMVKLERDYSAKANETYHRALTKEEQAAFVAEMKNDFYSELIEFMLVTGMRIGECAALEWSDVNLEQKKINVNKTVTRDINGNFIVGDSPKSESGKRDIFINDEIEEILHRQKRKMKSLDGIIKFSNRVFSTVNGTIIWNAYINRRIKLALERLDAKGIHIEHFTCHALRDTFATRCIEQGMQPKSLQKIMGHKNISVTMNIYAHVTDETQANAMAKIHVI